MCVCMCEVYKCTVKSLNVLTRMCREEFEPSDLRPPGPAYLVVLSFDVISCLACMARLSSDGVMIASIGMGWGRRSQSEL